MSSPASTNQKILAIGLIVIGLVIAGLFGLRSFHALRRFRSHPPPLPPPSKIETDVSLIRDWMTVPFVAHTYYVPDKILFDALKIPPQGNENKSLNKLNRAYYPNDNGFVLEKVRETVRANQPPPEPDKALTPSAYPNPSQP